jgi:hypothetical protein
MPCQLAIDSRTELASFLTLVVCVAYGPELRHAVDRAASAPCDSALRGIGIDGVTVLAWCADELGYDRSRRGRGVSQWGEWL